MQPDPVGEAPRQDARAELRQLVMSAFCGVLHDTRLSPLAVLELAAEAVGSVYREVADAHLGEASCPCGWQPNLPADVAALQAALALVAAPPPGIDLARVAVVGRA